VSDLALDPVSGDLLLEQGRARLVHGAEAVRQLWITRITLFKGEWFLDRSRGIDYQTDVLVKNAKQAVLRSIFAEVTRATTGVADVTKLRFDLNRATRLLTIEAEVVLDSGEDLQLSLSETIGG
jgi:hypothetical protein